MQLDTQCSLGSYLMRNITGEFNATIHCIQCEAGYACNGKTRAACQAGHVNPKLAQTSCRACSPGKYMQEWASTAFECHTCEAGKFARQGAATCTRCPRGTFGPADGLQSVDECQRCPRGHFCEGGGSAPVECPLGTHATEEGEAQCTSYVVRRASIRLARCG